MGFHLLHVERQVATDKASSRYYSDLFWFQRFCEVDVCPFIKTNNNNTQILLIINKGTG
jgi:hypothetical protein